MKENKEKRGKYGERRERSLDEAKVNKNKKKKNRQQRKTVKKKNEEEKTFRSSSGE